MQSIGKYDVTLLKKTVIASSFSFFFYFHLISLF